MLQEIADAYIKHYRRVNGDLPPVSEEDVVDVLEYLVDTRGLTLREAASPFVGAEQTYSAKAILENVGNAIKNGYETLGATDIGDLLLMCVCSESGDEESPHS